MENFQLPNIDVTGEGLTANASTNKRVTMENGIAELGSVELHEKTNRDTNTISKSVKVTFKDVLNLDDESKGHICYVSTSDFSRYKSVMDKLNYMKEHSSNEIAIAKFNALLSEQPAKYVMQNIQVTNPETGEITTEQKPHVYTHTKDNTSQFDELKALYPDKDLTFIWANKKAKKGVSSKRVLMEWVCDKETLRANLIESLSAFIGEEYDLEFGYDNNKFQYIRNLFPAS